MDDRARRKELHEKLDHKVGIVGYASIAAGIVVGSWIHSIWQSWWATIILGGGTFLVLCGMAIAHRAKGLDRLSLAELEREAAKVDEAERKSNRFWLIANSICGIGLVLMFLSNPDLSDFREEYLEPRYRFPDIEVSNVERKNGFLFSMYTYTETATGAKRKVMGAFGDFFSPPSKGK